MRLTLQISKRAKARGLQWAPFEPLVTRAGDLPHTCTVPFGTSLWTHGVQNLLDTISGNVVEEAPKAGSPASLARVERDVSRVRRAADRDPSGV